MLISMVALFLCATDPGPVDGFRANYAATRVKTEFVLEVGEADGRLISGGALWKKKNIGFREDAVWRVAGRWECDGAAEHIVCGPSGGEAESAARTKRAHRPQIDPQQASVEALFDGETIASHRLEDGNHTIQLEFLRFPPEVHQTPFMWFPPTPFPGELDRDYEGVEPKRSVASVAGRATELEVYRKDEVGGWEQSEVYYDSSIGYLPRFHRIIGAGHGAGGRLVSGARDMYLIDARPCAAGGFVPIEWYVVSYHFDREPTNYEVGKEFDMGNTRVGLIHYKATGFESRTGTVCMDQLKGIRFIAGVGGSVPVRETPSTLTLSQLKERLGRRKMTTPQRPVGPSLDFAELNEVSRPRGMGSRFYWVGAGLILGLVVYLVRRKRIASRHIVFLCLLVASGCGYGGKPIVHLVAAFDRPHYFNEANSPLLPLTLAVRNEGNQPVRIFEVSGGCTCRKVDQSRLPALLNPGENLKLPVDIHDPRSAETQYMAFNYSTDHGSLSTPVTLLVLPKHQLRPSAVTLSLLEGEDGAFELTHRAIYRTGEQSPEPKVVVPPVFAAINRSTAEGGLETLSGYSFRDSVYTFRLKDPGLGLRRSSIVLESPEEGKIADVAVVYRRTRFLHSAPETVYLGTAPVRVFLRCPDESVELTRLLSAPRGVRAVLSSTNELIVKLDDDAPEIINGTVKVGTTAKIPDPELRVPVVRYWRRASASASGSQREGS